ncbi:venom protease-like isoform X2 [Tenebrio molitor]|uniref:venom protease-like isoform X2 n=1 Tax=Tenebrio molitor TaxID=7067 RepID=UPI003624A206
MKTYFYLCFVFGELIAGLYCSPLFAGSKCHNSNARGVCTPITDCPTALSSVRNEGFHTLKRCGFDRFTEIVCCPDKDTIDPTTSLPSHKEDEPGEDYDPETRTTGVSKSKKACDKYTANLPIVLTYHIVGGENADVGEFPHMAALGFYNVREEEYRFDCGGTLISEYYIVTAAHCVVNIQQNELKIARLGVIDIPETIKKPDSKLDFNVVNVTVHKKYNWTEKFNDIALVKLEKKVTFTDKIRPACLYTKNDDPEKLIVTGWGATNLGGDRSSILQKATLNAVSLNECQKSYRNRTQKTVTKRQICASHNRSDACQGDSGGPLQTEGNSTIFSIVGITSYGIGCGSKYPGIYTRISSYLNWIEGIVWS